MSELRKVVAETFGERLSAAREKAGISQEELAHRAGVHRTVISKLEAGRRSPRLDTILKISGALEIEACSLISGLRWEPASTTPGRLKRS